MSSTWKLTVASFKMYFRHRETILWSFLFPLLLIVMFSFVNFGGMGAIHVGIIVTPEHRADVPGWIGTLHKVESFKIEEGDAKSELAALEKGDLDLVLDPTPAPAEPDTNAASTELTAYVNDGRPQQAQVGLLVIQRVLDEATFRHTPVKGRLVLKRSDVKSRNLTYIDFLLPGVIAMSIMQLGVFGVAFGFVSLKKRGIFRRLSVTPIRPREFITAQVAMRVVITMLQIGIMVGVGMAFLHLHFIGNLALMALLGILGAVVFLGFGFAIAGVSQTEDQVAPIANIVSLPMMLLSGIFFDRSNLPGIVRTITDFIPLTPLTDGLRNVAIEGATMGQVLPQIIWLLVWGFLSCLLAIKLFRWE